MKKIGSGGFATVYEHNGVAVKYLHHWLMPNESIPLRFEKEYLMTKSLGDIPGIIEVFDYCKHKDGRVSYSMQLCETNLGSVIQDSKPSFQEKLTFITEIVSIMAKVHKRGLIHRDICPSNILLDKGSILISDFGLVKNLDDDLSQNTINTAQWGHPNYTAPEQYENLKSATKESDVYSLGKLINFILTENPNNQIHTLSIVCNAATAIDPTFRYSDASELLDAINSLLNKINEDNFNTTCLEKITQNVLDDDVVTYLLDMDPVATFNNFHLTNYSSLLVKFLDTYPENSVQFITKLQNSMINCDSFESYDPYAYISYTLLLKNNPKQPYDTLMIATNILRTVAWDVNRFNAQDKIADLKKRDSIEPRLLDAL